MSFDFIKTVIYIVAVSDAHRAFLNFAETFKSDLMKIAMTTLSSKILSQDKVHFAQLAVDAVMRLKVMNFLHLTFKD